MATVFKQVKNNAKSFAVVNSLNNTTTSLTFSVATGTGSRFSQPGVGFYVTAWNLSNYYDPGDDPNMRIGLCTARSTDSLTVTWGQLGTPINAIPNSPMIAQLVLDQNLIDAYVAINTLENNTVTSTDVIPLIIALG